MVLHQIFMLSCLLFCVTSLSVGAPQDFFSLEPMDPSGYCHDRYPHVCGQFSYLCEDAYNGHFMAENCARTCSKCKTGI